ncbi:MAG: hypothetical protein H3C26_14045 [Rhodocyclaceae bacterium]|nr:hypothetical protein [Rhodocyclaceae bacterium]
MCTNPLLLQRGKKTADFRTFPVVTSLPPATATVRDSPVQDAPTTTVYFRQSTNS